MIPQGHVIAWRAYAPWSSDTKVEQDLLLSRAIVEIFSEPLLRDRLAFRGGTALHKLYLAPATRYSEDIDLVQMAAEPVGRSVDAVRERLDNWLGKPRWLQGERGFTLRYRVEAEMEPSVPLVLKVEINTREHFASHRHVAKRFDVDTLWFRGSAEVTTYTLEELLATKLRALYQRKKGRDLYDLWLGLTRGAADPRRVLALFEHYMEQAGTPVSRAQFEANLMGKLPRPEFIADITPLLRPGTPFALPIAAEVVLRDLIARLRGEAWKGQR